MKQRNRVISLLAFLLVLVTGVFLFALSASYFTIRQAQGLLAAVQQVRVGVSDYEAVLQITSPYRSHRTVHSDNGERAIQFIFDNTWLSRLRLAPYTDFIVNIHFEGDLVSWKSAREYVASSGCVASVFEVKRGSPFPQFSSGNKTVNHGVAGLIANSDAPATRIHVYDDNTYDEAGRQADWDFNLSCLSRLSGCQDARTMLPKVGATEHETAQTCDN